MFKDLNIKKVYDSEQDNLLDEFYIPVLKNAVFYRRITGFFSSSSLSSAAQGIAHFFSNGGTYQLISSVTLSEKDYKAFVEGAINNDSLLEKSLSFDPSNLQSEIEKDRLKVLSFLIYKKRLQIKIAVIPPESRGLFHEKIGILNDNFGDKIAFSGSINETGSGWINNIEEFKVFRSWVDEEIEYLTRDCEKFKNYWENNTKNFSIVDLPSAILNRILDIRPTEDEIEKVITRLKKNEPKEERVLRPYQIEAINNWVNNEHKGIFEMATGTGKTLTALGAVNHVFNTNKEYCTLIVVPYTHLITQWLKDIKVELKESSIIEVHGGATGWRKKLPQFLGDYNDGFVKKLTIITSYDTLCSGDFLRIFENYFNSERNYILIADEVHNFGAPQFSKGMISNIQKRLGLSATPTRWFDEEGTNLLVNYFDKTVFVYDLRKAIENHFLTPYDYYPIFVQMTDDEFEDYAEISRKIIKNINRSKDKYDDYLKMLNLKRSKIIRNSLAKMEYFANLVRVLQSGNKVDHLLIYCDSGGQLEEAQKVVNELGIVNHKFTESESKDEREKILTEFDDGTYNCLVAVKCLDEGVNIPSTKVAIILASSTNPREYVQRRGRVLRIYPGKEKAVIYDFIVLPPEKVEDQAIFKMEQQILKKELNRTQDFLETASNKAFILKNLSDIMLKYSVFLD